MIALQTLCDFSCIPESGFDMRGLSMGRRVVLILRCHYVYNKSASGAQGGQVLAKTLQLHVGRVVRIASRGALCTTVT